MCMRMRIRSKGSEVAVCTCVCVCVCDGRGGRRAPDRPGPRLQNRAEDRGRGTVGHDVAAGRGARSEGKRRSWDAHQGLDPDHLGAWHCETDVL